MKATRKSLCLFLLGAILLSSFACSDDKNIDKALTDESATSDEETTVPADDMKDNLPESLDYGGAAYRIMIPQSTHRLIYRYDLTAEENTGDALDDACYKRKTTIEDRFGVTIETVEGNGGGQEFNLLLQYYMAGDYAVDLVIPNGYGYGQAGGYLSEGIFANFNDFEYIDFSKPWWKQDIIESTALNGKVYVAYGDITVTRQCFQAMLFNKEIFDELGLEYPYEIVNDGKFTIDSVMTYGIDAIRDLDGNSVFDENDRWGLLTNETFLGNFQVYCGGGDIIKCNDVGELYLDYDADHIQRIAEKVEALLDSSTVYYFPGSENDKPFDMFNNGQGMFYMFDFASQYSKLRAIDSFDYGVLPQPKLDEAQEYYLNNEAYPVFLFSLLEDPERTGIITEALAAESLKQVYEPFREATMYGKIARDERDIEMIDLLYDSQRSSAGKIFAENQTMLKIINQCVIRKSFNVQSLAASLIPSVEASLEQFNENLK